MIKTYKYPTIQNLPMIRTYKYPTIQNRPMIRTYKYPMNYHTQIDKQAKIYLLKNGKFTNENTSMINFTTQLFLCILD